jgi:GH25 family lysozyme M1 (1,4-beta-N-acetylmuramidase)
MKYMHPLPKGSRKSQGFAAFPGGFNPAGGHTGDDWAVDVGTPVRAEGDGIITYADWASKLPADYRNDGSGPNPYWFAPPFGGIMASLDCGPVVFHHGHLVSTPMNKGQRVKKGDIIGYSGNTGAATTGPHLHHEAMPEGWNFHNGTYGRVNPAIYVDHFWEDVQPVPLAGNERMVGGDKVNLRAEPKLGAEILRVIEPKSKEVWEGYVHGETVDMGNGAVSDIWLKDSQGYASILFFDPGHVQGLPDLTPKVIRIQHNEARAGDAVVNQRSAPRLDAPVVREIPAGSLEVWEGYVLGDWVDMGPGAFSNRWLKDSIGYASVLFFDRGPEDSLKDLTPPPLAPAPAPTPEAPTPTPAPPVLAPGTLQGIDISNHQGGINVRPTGAQFVGIKVSEGVGWLDPSLAANTASARAADAPAIFYHFARPVGPENSPEAEARTFLAAVLPLLAPGDLLALDWEAEHQENTGWALEWLRLVEKHTGRVPLIYMNASTANAHDWDLVQARYPLWLAAYPSSAKAGFRNPGAHPAAEGWRVVIWQYSSTGNLPGYGGDLDLNVFYGDAQAWEELATQAVVEAPVVVPEPASPPAPQGGDAEVLMRFFSWLVGLFVESKTKKH